MLSTHPSDGGGKEESEPGPERIGPYRLEGELGGGGMGDVYRAVDERLARPVAIKHVKTPLTMEGPERERFRREANAIARLSHPAIVQVFDVLEDDRGGWIVMELVEGRPLSSLVAEGPLAADAALPLVIEISEALAEAHSKGILHRDLKTDNVMVTPAGRAKLLDFGLARQLYGEAQGGATLEGSIVGTPHAMSPEQAMSLDLDARSDLFSLGSLIYEVLTGVRPFHGADMVATLHQVCVVPHRPADELEPGIPEELSRLVDRLLEKEPDARPLSAREVARALRRIARALPAPEPFGAAEATTAELVPASAASLPGGERRQITLLSCELAAHSGSLDPEEILAVRPELQRLAAEMATRFGGEIGELSDQGLTMLFGYPRAREDDARRALLAAHGIVVGVGFLAANAGTEDLSVRVGVHTGPAVVSGEGQRRLTLGETATVAAAVQKLAPPGAVLLSAETREIVAPFARTEALSETRLPGPATPLATFRWLGEKDAEGTAAAAARRSPMVGRRRELALLLARWQLAREGTGQVVLLAGEVGIGKTRLVQALRERLAEDSAVWLSCQCSPFAGEAPFAPITDLLHRLTRREGAGAPRLEALEALARPYGVSAAVPVLASLLSIPAAAEEAEDEPGPEERRRKTFETLLALLEEKAKRQPLALVIEDLHWVDPSTLELLELLVDQVRGLPVMLLISHRSDFRPPWSDGSRVTCLTLGRLDRRQVGSLIRHLAGDRAVGSELEEAIAERSDGVPLFVGEVARAMLESPPPAGSGAFPSPAVPVRIQDLLASRLDRLGSARPLARQAAALGRTFTRELLAAVSPLAEDELSAALEELVREEIVYRQGTGPETRYTFKHALIQDAAYQSLLKRERRRLHRAIAEAMERARRERDAAEGRAEPPT